MLQELIKSTCNDGIHAYGGESMRVWWDMKGIW
jgi:hypothetical protein